MNAESAIAELEDLGVRIGSAERETIADLTPG